MIDVLFVAFNRLTYTRESYTALLENTNWDIVNRLYVHDDGSTDGTAEWLDAAPNPDVDVVFESRRRGGPVAAMNWLLDQSSADQFAKVDNDFVMPPGWLDELALVQSAHPNIDIVGSEPMIGDPRPRGRPRGIVEARHIGGKGLIRMRAFERSGCRPQPGGFNGYQGFTQWQERHPDVIKAWVSPDLQAFGLDQLPFEPWVELADRYAELEWHRRWPPYHVGAGDYWAWWQPRFEVEFP